MNKNKNRIEGSPFMGGSSSVAVGGRRALTQARRVALVGIMAATIECGKLALAAVPNVEAVTLLTALFGYVFGLSGVLATVVFVCIEPIIWGVGPWFISYLLYWPAVAMIFWLLGRRRSVGIILPTALAVLLTVFFGLLTSLVEVGLFSGSYDSFFYRFSVYYLRGVWFYVTQTVTNAVIFPLLFKPLSTLLRRVKL